MPPLLEIACFSPSAAHAAILAGASRIEFCHSYTSGGLTPSPAALHELLALSASHTRRVPINLMIKFAASPHDYTMRDRAMSQQCLAFIRAAKLSPATSGFVFGFLRADGSIDQAVNWELVRAAYPKPCTFHRAFDHARGDLYGRLETVRRCGFTTILTSGCVGPATQGTESLRALVQMAAQMEVTVMVGGGVRAGNLERLMEETGAEAFHTSAMSEEPPDGEEGMPDCDAIAEMRGMLERKFPGQMKPLI